jgi:hypothetical protein
LGVGGGQRNGRNGSAPPVVPSPRSRPAGTRRFIRVNPGKSGHKFMNEAPQRQIGARERNQFPRVRVAFGDFGGWHGWQPAAAGNRRSSTQSRQIKVNPTKSSLSNSFRAPTPQPVGARAVCGHKAFSPGIEATRRRLERDPAAAGSSSLQMQTHPTLSTTSRGAGWPTPEIKKSP